MMENEFPYFVSNQKILIAINEIMPIGSQMNESALESLSLYFS